ncbi:MAG: hypothetical protein K8T25_14355 [Planctomycetia bacterium]|nr:hypothetical protein [Planctomycetia bacterium]
MRILLSLTLAAGLLSCASAVRAAPRDLAAALNRPARLVPGKKKPTPPKKPAPVAPQAPNPDGPLPAVPLDFQALPEPGPLPQEAAGTDQPTAPEKPAGPEQPQAGDDKEPIQPSANLPADLGPTTPPSRPRSMAEAQAAVEEAGQKLVAAQQAADEAYRELTKTVQEYEESQPADSPLMKAKEIFRTALAARNAAVNQFKKSDAYRALTRQAIEDPDQLKRVREEQKKLLEEDRTVSLAEVELSIARKKFESLRLEGLKSVPGWTSASEKLRIARLERQKAAKELYDKRLEKLTKGGAVPGFSMH